MSTPKHDKFRIKNVIDLGTKGRFGPGREKEFAKKADKKTFQHCVERGSIEYPLIKEEKEVDEKTASGSDAKSLKDKAEQKDPEYEGTGDWRTVEGKAGWWRIIDPEGNFITNKREDEAKEFVAEKNGVELSDEEPTDEKSEDEKPKDEKSNDEEE